MSISHVFIALMMVSLVLVLLSGIGLMAMGGEMNKKYGNKLMVLRVALQGVIVLTMGVMFMMKH